MSVKDGGPAFPSVVMLGGPNGDRAVQMGGLSLRDYFAAAALHVLVFSYRGPTVPPFESTASDAYRYADAVLAEREKQS